MSGLVASLIVVVQVMMAVMLGVLIFRNGRNGTYQVASETSRPYELSAASSTYVRDADVLYEGIPLDAELLELDRRALREAYHTQLQLLWSTWLKGQAGDPKYFANGLKIARRAYTQASEQIVKREKEIQQRDAH